MINLDGSLDKLVNKLSFQNRREHEEICPYKPVQCPEFDCSETRPMNEIFKHFRLEHHHHFVNAHGSVFNGDIRCDDSNMIMGVERKWAPTMMKIDEDEPGSGTQHFFLEILRTKHGGTYNIDNKSDLYIPILM